MKKITMILLAVGLLQSSLFAAENGEKSGSLIMLAILASIIAVWFSYPYVRPQAETFTQSRVGYFARRLVISLGGGTVLGFVIALIL